MGIPEHSAELSPYFNPKKLELDTLVAENVQVRYKFEKQIGEGAFGQVKIATLRENPNKKFAIKSIPRQMMKSLDAILSNETEETENMDNYMENIESELQVIMSLDHPNIIKLH